MSAFKDNSGKISYDIFNGVLLPNCGQKRKEVILGPRFGVDTSIIDLGNGQVLAVSSDPLSLIPMIGLEASAWLSVHLLANDMATTGKSPQYAQFVLNLPPSFTLEDFKIYWGHIHQFCKDIGTAITGGHTGQFEGQNSTVSGGGTMFLTGLKKEIISSNNAKPGDVIIVTKEAALTSTSILALCFPDTVKNKLGDEIYRKVSENFYRTSSLKEALAAAELLVPNKELNAMHDVTEGGILGAVNEMAEASGCGFMIDSDKVPVSPEVQSVAGLFEIDPRYCIGAGSMIMSVKKGKEAGLIDHFREKGLEATVVGSFTDKKNDKKILEQGKENPFTFSGVDPYWEAFFKALKSGLK